MDITMYITNTTFTLMDSPENATETLFNYTDNYTDSIFKTKLLYKYYIPPMLVFCVASVVINIRVLLSVHWIRKPLSPTLHISLSLAAADAATSTLLGIGLLLNSYLPTVYEINLASSICLVLLMVEIYRLSGIIITVVHLLALSINHYVGILKPLRYISIMTTRKTAITIAFLWIIPIACIKIYFLVAAEDGFWTNGCERNTFMNHFTFRLFISCLFFIPLILMIFCYTHILYIVRKQQKMWAKRSRFGSTRYRGVRTSRHGVNTQQKQMEGNVKAIYTTLLILGSCVLGWLPAVIIFLTVCQEGCMFSAEDINNLQKDNEEVFFFIIWLTNVLIIMKTLANPIIYSYRMNEIKEGTRRMHAALTRCCHRLRRRDSYGSESQQGFGGSMRAGVTALCKLNGNISHRSIGRSELANTLL